MCCHPPAGIYGAADRESDRQPAFARSIVEFAWKGAAALNNEDKQAQQARKSAFKSALSHARRHSAPEPAPASGTDREMRQIDKKNAFPAQAAHSAGQDAEIAGSENGIAAAAQIREPSTPKVSAATAIIVLAAMAGLLIGAFCAFALPNDYYAQTEILADANGLDPAALQGRLHVATSGMVVREVVNRLGLDRDPEFNGEAGGGISRLFTSIGVNPVQTSGAGRKAIAAKNLADALSVNWNNEGYVASIGVHSQDGQKAALLANTVTSVFIDADARMQDASKPDNSSSEAEQIAALRKAADVAEQRAESFKAEIAGNALKPRSASGGDTSATSDALAKAKGEVAKLDAQLAAIRKLSIEELISNGLQPSPETESLKEHRDQYVSLKRDTDRLAISLGDRSPLVLRMRSQLDRIRDNLGDRLAKTVQSLEQQRSSAEAKVENLTARMSDLQAQQGDGEEKNARLAHLERKAADARALYENSLLGAASGSTENLPENHLFKVITQAEPPLSPAGPQRLLVILTGGLFGLLFGLLIAKARSLSFGQKEPRSEKPALVAEKPVIAESPATKMRPSGISAEKSDDGTSWPSPDMMPANPYDRPAFAGKASTPAAYRGLAAENSRPHRYGPKDADIAALKERLEAFREKTGRPSRAHGDDGES